MNNSLLQGFDAANTPCPKLDRRGERGSAETREDVNTRPRCY